MPNRSPTRPVPPFLALAGHPLRWRMLVELARSDRQVSELTAAVGEPQNLVSYHLGRLRAGGLVSSHRSSYDGRATYYRVHLDRCGESLAATGAALHPGLAARAAVVTSTLSRHTAVLFLCTGNGTRSQIAEALLRRMTDDAIEVASAGSHPKPVHPNAVRVLAERGIDIADAESKSLATFDGHRFDHVITLCDKVREICPEFPGQRTAAHWSIEDPSRLPGSRRATLPAFRAVAADLESRIGFFLAQLEAADLEDHKEHSHGR